MIRVLLTAFWPWVLGATVPPEGCDAKSTSLLSLKADMSKSLQGVAEHNTTSNGTSCHNCSLSNHTLNQSLEDLVKNVLQSDMNQSSGMPDPVGDASAGSLGQNLEFLFLKVAQLETAAELQNIEFKFAKQELEHAQLEIQTLKDRLDHKDLALKQVTTELATLRSERGLPPHAEPQLEKKHRSAWLRQVKEQRQKRQRSMDKHTKDLLSSVLKKHHHQNQRRWGAAKNPPPAKASPGESLTQRAAERRSQGGSAEGAELDRSVAAKGTPIVDDIIDAGEDVVDAVTDGTGLVGDALSDAYNAAADKVEFVANTVIDTVEQAIAILSQGFDWSASCPNWQGPSMSISDSQISVDWGRQRCRITLVGQTMTLFDFNFGNSNINFPAPLRAMIGVGQNVENCLSGGASASDIFKCVASAIGSEWLAEIPAFQVLFGLAEEVGSCTGDALEIFTCIAAKIGDAILRTMPPFSILMQLGPMLQDFVAFFAELASALIHSLLSESTSLLQQAVKQGTFPKTNEKPLHVAGPKGLSAQLRRVKRSSRSLLQREAAAGKAAKPTTDVDNGIVGFGTTEALPYASMLITQFGGDEFDSGSCLAFAPKNRSGANGDVTQRDWQVPSPDSVDFVKLEPWAVPCDNQWAKDNAKKWEGYSFYTYESVIEKCAAISYSMSAQPVLAFVGGLEFDLLPAPLIEITTEVCWPDRVTAPDLSLIVFTARSAGIVLFTHTIRLHRRFGSDTDFTSGNFKDSVERTRNYFGKGTGEDDDKALQVLSRTALAQTNSSESKPEKSSSTSKQKEESKFRVTQEELFLASAKYDKHLGLNITSKYEGRAAAQRVQALLSKKISALQEDEAALAVHELFELSSPSNSLVGFNVKGELASGYLQLRVRLNFGPVESPTETIPLIDLVDNLRVVLAALPFVSQDSKQKAIDAMGGTHFDLELPVSEVMDTLSLGSNIATAGLAGVRDAVVLRRDAICSVQAAVAPSAWNELATLPADCRPSGTLIFKLPTHGLPAAVDVSHEGLVSWLEGGQDSWLSLGGLVFPAAAPGWPLDLGSGWSNYGNSYAEAKYTLVASLCFVDGVIETTNRAWGTLLVLPAHCRPTKKLTFNVNVHGGTARVDVTTDGEVSYVSGATGSWLSLTGIVFSTRNHADNLLSLATGWESNSGSDDEFGFATYSMSHGHCLLEGRIKGDLVSGGGLLATLPVECWPMRKLIFSKALGSGPIEVDVNQYGEVSYYTNTSSTGTISLSGIIFSAPSGGQRFLPTAGAWYSDSAGFGDAVLTLVNGFCFVEGRLKGGSFASGGLLATLPQNCRPTERLSFSVNHHKYPHRVDVKPNGEVQWMAGFEKYSWVSLSGIHFAPTDLGKSKLSTRNGWAGQVEVTKRNGICMLEGMLLGNGGTSTMAKLPDECIPKRQLIFNMIAEDQTQRVDVLDDGFIEWKGVAPTQTVGGITLPSIAQVTLSGILIVPDEPNAVKLELQNGWAHYGGSHGKAKYVLMDGLCVLQGLVKDGTRNVVIAQLPEECRPTAKRLIFNMNVQNKSARVDVLNSGTIYFMATSSWDVTWLSLTGISFTV